MSDLIKLTPLFHEKIWGGRQLETVFGYDIPEGPIGECWAISAHPNGDCQIAEGPYAGHTLSWLWAEHRELFGNCEGKEFPLLIKILDAREKPSAGTCWIASPAPRSSSASVLKTAPRPHR